MSKQYRTLGEGDRRLPGWQVSGGDLLGWIDGNPARDGLKILLSDLECHEYRVPCSATVAPGGYEVVDSARLPEGARVGKRWVGWSPARGEWVACGDAGTAPLMGARFTYAAPAEELAALYAQADAERAGAAIGAAFAAEAERLADSLRQHLAQQPAAAPVSPWVYVGDRLPPGEEPVVVSTAPLCDAPRPSVILTWSGERWYRDRVLYSGAGAVHWLDRAAVGRLAAERDEARAEVKRLRAQIDAVRAALKGQA